MHKYQENVKKTITKNRVLIAVNNIPIYPNFIRL